MDRNSPHCLISSDLPLQMDQMEYSSGGVIDRYESIYAVLSRFALANTLSKRQLVDLFTPRVVTHYSGRRGLGDLRSINPEQVMRRLRVSESQLNEMFFSWHPVLQAAVSCLYFRYCSICASVHRHYTVFQAETLSRCPFHSLPLRTNCAYCGESVRYSWSSTLLSFPFRCARCREPLGVKHGRKVFFDLYTAERAHRLAWVNGQRTAVQSKEADVCANGTAEKVCPGYLVCGARNGDFDQWCVMANLPLCGRNWADKDWSSFAGYIQVRGARVRAQRKRIPGDASIASPEISGYLMQCLKSILRNLRKCWKIERQPFGNVGSVDPKNSLQRYREEAYSLLLRHWCGKTSQPNWHGDRVGNSVSLSVINNWLSAAENTADAQAGPAGVIAWFLAHQFCDWVVESIAAIARMIERPPSIPDNCLLEQIQWPQKPLWLVAFIESAACTSYRVIHYHHYPSCLSSMDVWFGSNYGD